MKKPLIIIAGPTAVGKSELSVILAKKINGEIISADSMQVYKGMDIGSAKITKEEMGGIKHYLLDVLDPKDDFNVALFKQMALDACEKIYSAGKVPIICGGTGFYIQALLYDINFDESEGEISEYRQMLEDRANVEGPDLLYDELMHVDPESCNIIHKNNVKRVIRALEFYHETGKKISEHNAEQRSKEASFNSCYFVLNDIRENVYKKIDSRVDKMIDVGLVAEVEKLKNLGLTCDNNSMQGLGYKEILNYLDGNCTLDEAVYTIKRDSRHFAKRQITWFKRENDVIWIDKEKFDYDNNKIIEKMISECVIKNIIQE